jgi:hypothetical protein
METPKIPVYLDSIPLLQSHSHMFEEAVQKECRTAEKY